MNSKLIAEFRISRRREGGIRVYVRSKVFAEWVKHIAVKKDCESHLNSAEHWNMSNKPGWNKHRGYIIPQRETLKPLHSWGSMNLILKDDRLPNLAFLKARGLENGVIFDFPGLYSSQTMQRWKSRAREQIVKIYQDYIKKEDCRIAIFEVEEISLDEDKEDVAISKNKSTKKG